MTPEERHLIDSAIAWYRACGPYGPEGASDTPLGTLADAVELLNASREEGQEEMGTWSAENANNNASRQADRAREASRNRMDDANDSAHPNKVTMAELQKRKR